MEGRGGQKTTKTMAEYSKRHQEALIKKLSNMEAATYITGPPAAFKNYCRGGGNIIYGIIRTSKSCLIFEKKSFRPKAHLHMQKIFPCGGVGEKAKRKSIYWWEGGGGRRGNNSLNQNNNAVLNGLNFGK